MEKSPIFLGAVGNVNGQTGVSLALDKEHFRQRRALGYLFTNSALRHLEDLMQNHIDTFIAILETKAIEDRPVDVSDWCKLHKYHETPFTKHEYRYIPCI
jgi:cytochrome P450